MTGGGVAVKKKKRTAANDSTGRPLILPKRPRPHPALCGALSCRCSRVAAPWRSCAGSTNTPAGESPFPPSRHGGVAYGPRPPAAAHPPALPHGGRGCVRLTGWDARPCGGRLLSQTATRLPPVDLSLTRAITSGLCAACPLPCPHLLPACGGVDLAAYRVAGRWSPRGGTGRLGVHEGLARRPRRGARYSLWAAAASPTWSGACPRWGQ